MERRSRSNSWRNIIYDAQYIQQRHTPLPEDLFTSRKNRSTCPSSRRDLLFEASHRSAEHALNRYLELRSSVLSRYAHLQTIISQSIYSLPLLTYDHASSVINNATSPNRSSISSSHHYLISGSRVERCLGANRKLIYADLDSLRQNVWTLVVNRDQLQTDLTIMQAHLRALHDRARRSTVFSLLWPVLA